RESTPRELKRELSGDIDSMLLKCLEKEPGNRYRSAEELGKELNRYLRGEPVEARSNRLVAYLLPFARRRSGWIVAAFCSLAAIGTGGVRVPRRTLLMMGPLLFALITGY